MLNLSAFGVEAGAVDYYLARSQGCGEHAHDLHNDRLAYYEGRQEARGVWLGAGAASLGMTGEVDPAAFRQLLLEGMTPDGVQRVGPQLRRNEAGDLVDRRVAGVDCTFRAPKSMSLIYAFTDDQGTIVEAHEHAAAEALRYLESVASHSRRGKAGSGRSVPGDGFIAASFRHRDARPSAGADHGDPLLHSHLVVANMVRAEDGKWGALETRALFRESKTAGYIYQAVLREQLTERLGVKWNPVVNGMADIEGIPREVITHFSRRRGEIETQLGADGAKEAKDAQRVTLSSRGKKAEGVDNSTLRGKWAAHGAAIGYGEDQVRGLLVRSCQRRPDSPSTALSAAALLGPDGLTKRSSTFRRRDVLRAVAEGSPEGAGLDELNARTDALLAGPDVIAVGDRGDLRYTTAEMLAVERHVAQLGESGRDAGLARVAPAVVDRALASVPFDLGQDQAVMVRGLLTSGHAVEVVQAAAGTGKTTALSAARLGWEAAGYRVLGSSTAARAARELADGGGIAESTTLARLLGDLEHADHGGFQPGTVLVIDEAGMVGSRVLERVLAVAERDQAKVVLVGDSKQLPEIDAGGSFAGLAQRLGAHNLTENRRQALDWEREAVALLRDGHSDRALDRYVEQGRVTVSDTATGARAKLAADWWDVAAQSPEVPPLMIADRRVDIDDLNGLGRALMAGADRLSGETLTVAGKDYQTGDRVICLKNDRRIGCHNGDRGTVQRVADGGMVVRLDTGAGVTLPARYVAAGRVQHGYASTVYKAQGSTVREAFVLGKPEAIFREGSYVSMTRAQDSTRLYLVTGRSTDVEHDQPREEVRDAVDHAKWSMRQPKAQTAALDLTPAMASAVAAGDAQEWRGRAAQVAVEADPITRGREGPVRSR